MTKGVWVGDMIHKEVGGEVMAMVTGDGRKEVAFCPAPITIALEGAAMLAGKDREMDKMNKIST